MVIMNQSDATEQITYGQDQQDKYIIGRYENVGSYVIEITEDKLRNILMDFRQNLLFIIAWATPFSILISAITTLVSTDFKKALGLDASVWNAIFIILIIIAVFWLLADLVFLIQKRKLLTINQLIKKIKDIKT